MSLSLLNFTDERPARLLLAYFTSQGIKGNVRERLATVKDEANQAESINDSTETNNPRPESDDSLIPPESLKAINTEPNILYELAIDNTADQERAMDIAKAFLANPRDPKYQQAAWNTGDTSASKVSMFHGLEIESLQAWDKHIFTHSMGLFIGLVYFVMYMGYSENVFNALNIQYYNELSQNHEWWRLLGPTFMHGGVAHLLMNLCWWWLLASRVERTFGTSSLAILFVVSALIANVAELMHTGPGFGGMSSVNYALFGFTACIGWLRPNWGLYLPKGIVIFLVIWLVIGYLDILWVTTSDDLHFFGMLTGAVLALMLHQATNLMGNSKED
jgi:GlpG protein